ncbi:NAD-dependent succinate-semialdehyde dehydrogenase [Acidiferrobacter sp.]|uniref:NAD-dependent succinate-semialdehyde dehydrogenase n=1 Tax=Acidiferrobacter sp. TaxID=1872107 RepID=UPI0026322AB0|nr:NAD-dependent succinate-semialdehyde dehydrogenase [Acidiferrobacter sp.]
MSFDSINPATDERVASFPETSPAEQEAALGRAALAADAWRLSHAQERGALLQRVAALLRAGRDHYADIITLEVGKPVTEARAEVEKCAWACDYYAENAERLLGDEKVDVGDADARVAFLPLGVILAIMPWNFPFWQVFRFATAALTAGNAALLKHAANVPQCALSIARIFREAGAPEGLFQALLVRAPSVPALIADARVHAVTLTGSEAAGRAVAAAAGRALKKTVLELGGSDAFIVLADADLDRAAKAAVVSRYQNAGQSCIAAKRLILVESVAEPFLEHFTRHVKALKVGDPRDPDVLMGPLARRDLRETLHEQVTDALSHGASARLGCQIPEGPGSYYPPSILDHVRPGMRAYGEELFGPVAIILRARDSAHALALANDNRYGLGASLWTGDAVRGAALARDLQSGSSFVNAPVKSDPRLPFGGVKASGYGRELALYGVREFTNIKTLWVAP